MIFVTTRVWGMKWLRPQDSGYISHYSSLWAIIRLPLPTTFELSRAWVLRLWPSLPRKLKAKTALSTLVIGMLAALPLNEMSSVLSQIQIFTLQLVLKKFRQSFWAGWCLCPRTGNSVSRLGQVCLCYATCFLCRWEMLDSWATRLSNYNLSD